MAIRYSLIAAAMTVLSVLPASALTVTSIESRWENVASWVGGEGTNEIRWGKSTGHGKSGYNFAPSETDFETEADTPFVLGTFQHLNFPVRGKFLETAELVFSFTIEGVSSAINSVYTFDHYETANSPSTCANGEANKTGVNVAGCADRVRLLDNADQHQAFEVNGTQYILDVLGFRTDGELLTDFWTRERQVNTADLMAVFRLVEPIEPTSEVPLPASGLLLLGGIVGLFAKRKFL